LRQASAEGTLSFRAPTPVSYSSCLTRAPWAKARPLEDAARIGVHLHLPPDRHAGALEPEAHAADPGKAVADGHAMSITRLLKKPGPGVLTPTNRPPPSSVGRAAT